MIKQSKKIAWILLMSLILSSSADVVINIAKAEEFSGEIGGFQLEDLREEVKEDEEELEVTGEKEDKEELEVTGEKEDKEEITPREDETGLIEELDGELDEIIDELADIEIFVPQDLRDRLADITGKINNINDWASKEPIFNKQASLEEDINIKDQLGYLKGQIDAYVQNPSPDLKDRIQAEINTLRDRIKNQKLSENAKNNDYQLDLLEGILGGQSDVDIESDIQKLLDKIKSDLESRNGQAATSETREDVSKVGDKIDELVSSNSNKSEFNRELNTLTKDIEIKDELDSLEGLIQSYIAGEEDLKKEVDLKITMIRAYIDKEDLQPHKDQNKNRLNELIKLITDKDTDNEKEKENKIKSLLEKIKTNLGDLKGERVTEPIREDYRLVNQLILELSNKNENKYEFTRIKNLLNDDMEIKEELFNLDNKVNMYISSMEEGLKKDIFFQANVLRARIKKEELIPHKSQNEEKLNSILEKLNGVEENIEVENENRIKELIDKIKEGLAELNGEKATDEIKNQYTVLIGLIDKLKDENSNKYGYIVSAGKLKEDIAIKESVYNLGLKVSQYEKLEVEDDEFRTNILKEYFRIKGEINEEELSPHKVQNMNKLDSLKFRIDSKDKELENQVGSNIEGRLSILRADLERLNGSLASDNIKNYSKVLEEDILRLSSSNIKKEKFREEIKILLEDISIKDEIEVVNRLVSEYENSKDKVNLEEDIEDKLAVLRIRILKENLEPHKIQNGNKLKSISDRFEKSKENSEKEKDEKIESLLEKIKKDLADLKGEKADNNIISELVEVESMISDLPPADENKKDYKNKLLYLQEDKNIKDGLYNLDSMVVEYIENEDESIKNNIEKAIKELSDRISKEILTPHDIHNKEKLLKIKEKFNSKLEEEDNNEIGALLEKIKNDLADLKGGDVTPDILSEYERVNSLIDSLKNNELKDEYAEKSKILKEDISIKDWLKEVSEEVGQYVSSGDKESSKLVLEDLQKLRGVIIEEKLEPHKKQNMDRLNKLYFSYKEKVEENISGLEENINLLLEKIKKDLELRNGDQAEEKTRLEYEKLEKLINDLSANNKNKSEFIMRKNKLKEDIGLKDEIKKLSDRVADYIKDNSKEEKSKLIEDIMNLRGRTKLEKLVPHRDQNLNKLKSLEEIISNLEDNLEKEKEEELEKLLNQVKEELANKKGNTAENYTREKLNTAKELIASLKSDNKNRVKYYSMYKDLEKDIVIKDDLEKVNQDVEGYLNSSNEEDKENISKEILRLRGVIKGENLSPHREDNMEKLNSIYKRFKGKEENQLDEEENIIESLLKHIKDELEKLKGSPSTSEIGKDMERAKKLINNLPNTSSKRPLFNGRYNELYEDIVIKNQIKYINNTINEYRLNPSEDLKLEVYNTSARIKIRIENEKLSPHKEDNMKKLNDLLVVFEDILKDKENNLEEDLSKLLDKIRISLKEKDGNPADKKIREDLALAKTYLDKIKDKSKLIEKYRELEEDIKIKDSIFNLNKSIDEVNKDNLKSKKESIEREIISLNTRIDKELLTPHKEQNQKKLKEIESKYREKLDLLQGEVTNKELEDRLETLLNKLRLDLEKLKGDRATDKSKEMMGEIESLLIKLKDTSPKKKDYEERAGKLKTDISIKESLFEIEKDIENIKLYPNAEKVSLNTSDFNNIKQDIINLEKVILREDLQPHNKHNKERLLDLNYTQIYKKLALISEVLEALDGDPADREVKTYIKNVKEEIENMELPSEEKKLEEERKELFNDTEIKDRLYSLKKEIDLYNKSNSSSREKRIRDEIKSLKQDISNQKIKPLEEDNIKKLRSLEKDFKTNSSNSSSHSSGGTSSGSSHSSGDKTTEKDKIEDKLDDIEREVEDKEDGKDISKDKIEKELDELLNGVDKISDKKDRDKILDRIHRLKDRLKETGNLVKIDNNYHKAYINGYADNTIRPEDTATREEVAKVIYSILDEKKISKYKTKTHRFTDVKNGSWSEEYIATLSNARVLTGYAGSLFKPKQPITRGEVTVILAKISGLNESKSQKSEFKDIKGHWAEGYINAVVKKGWIKGYEAGSFRPNKNITRAELVSMMNNLLRRERGAEISLDTIQNFTDLKENKWYYKDMIEATNSHRP